MRISDWSSDVCSSELPIPNRIMFDLRRVMRTQYRIDDYQQNYFVLSGFDELLRVTLETDFAPLYAELDSLPDIDIAQLVEGDGIVSRGTQEYPAAKDRTNVVSGKSVSVSVNLGGRRRI